MSWTAVAKKEYVENVRNAWIIGVTALFLVLTLGTSAFASVTSGGGTANVRFTSITVTIITMHAITDFLLPILALMLGFATLAGERESGSLGLLVAQPITRSDIVFGKAIGLWGVLATALVVGLGGGGLFVVARTGASGADLASLATFVAETLLWGAAWISITLLISAFFQRRGTAIAGSIGVWFLFGVVWTILIVLLVLVTEGSRLVAGQKLPAWFILTQLLNPNDVYNGLLATSLANYQSLLSSFASQLLPDYYTSAVFSVAMALWIVLPYWGAHVLFHQRDV